MISKVLYGINHQLNDYLKLYFNLMEDIAFVSPPVDKNNTYPSNRVSTFLLNIERELGAGINFKRQQVSNDNTRQSSPAWQLSLYILFATVFNEKQYKESLQIFSGITSFIQKNNLIRIPGIIEPYAFEQVNIDIQELSNIWSIFGSTYYPSVLCKVRFLEINQQEIINLSQIVKDQHLESGLKK